MKENGNKAFEVRLKKQKENEKLNEEKNLQDEKTKDYLKFYAKKIYSGYYTLYSRFPLSNTDFSLAKVLEENFDEVRKIIYSNMLKKLGYDLTRQFGLKSSFKNFDIKSEQIQALPTQLFPLPFDDKFRKNILTADKFLVKATPFQRVKSTSGRELKARSLFFISKIKLNDEPQYVLVKVDILRSIKKIGFLEQDAGSSVNITLKLGRHADVDLNLSRLDYKPLGAHQNFLDENDKVIPPDLKLWRDNTLDCTHVHFNSEKVQALKPSNLNSGEATMYTSQKQFIPMAQDFLTGFHFYNSSIEFNDKTPLSEIYENQTAKKKLDAQTLWGDQKNERTNN